MDIIYADSLFLLNTVIDYLILLAAGKVCARPLRRGRMALAAALGGAYALAAVLLPAPFGSAPVKLLAGLALVALAYGVDKHFPRCALAFFAVSAAFGGAVYAAASLGGYPRTGRLYIPVSMKVLVLSFAACYALVSLVFRHAGARTARKIMEVELGLGGRSVRFRALHDSGNELVDPLTGDRVLVVQAETLAPLFPSPSPLAEPDPLAALEKLSALPGLAGRFRLLPCGSVAGDGTLLLCFRPDSLSVDGRRRRDLLAAAAPARLSPDGDYQALIHIP